MVALCGKGIRGCCVGLRIWGEGVLKDPTLNQPNLSHGVQLGVSSGGPHPKQQVAGSATGTGHILC
jgi:hypothetical protein